MSFERIEKTFYADPYVIEVWATSTGIDSLRKRLLNIPLIAESLSNAQVNKMSNESDPHDVVSSILSHAARLHKLFQATSKRENETEEEYSFRKDRSKFLRKLLLPKKKTPHEIFKSGVRNATEHFDERLDLLSRNLLGYDSELNQKAILYNLTLSKTSLFDNWERVIPIKVLIASELKYFMLDRDLGSTSVNLQEIFEENTKILFNCMKWAKSKPDEKGEVIGSAAGILKMPPHLMQ